MIWYTKWKARRELKKTAKILELFCDNMPAKFFENLIFDSNNKPLSPDKARNELRIVIDRMRRT